MIYKSQCLSLAKYLIIVPALLRRESRMFLRLMPSGSPVGNFSFLTSIMTLCTPAISFFKVSRSNFKYTGFTKTYPSAISFATDSRFFPLGSFRPSAIPRGHGPAPRPGDLARHSEYKREGDVPEGYAQSQPQHYKKRYGCVNIQEPQSGELPDRLPEISQGEDEKKAVPTRIITLSAKGILRIRFRKAMRYNIIFKGGGQALKILAVNQLDINGP